MLVMSSDDRQPERIPREILETALSLWRQSAGEHSLPITGSSMLPLIEHGDSVLIESGPAGILPGHLVVFRKGDGLVGHRLLSKVSGKGLLLTKGDNAFRADPLVAEDEVIGRVIAVQRGGKTLSLNSSSWRLAGRLIAALMLAWTKLMARIDRMDENASTPFLIPLLMLGGRITHALFRRGLTVLLPLFGRWRIVESPRS